MMNKRWVGSLIVIMSTLAGCASTRDLPPTVLGPAPVVASSLRQVVLDIDDLSVDDADVGGGHHEGLAQVRQPWIWNITDEQRQALYGEVRQVAAAALIDELRRQGLQVRLLGDDASARRARAAAGEHWRLEGKLQRVELNTFGRGLQGTFEGFGSAGNYWEARVVWSELRVTDRQQREVWQGRIEQYAKRPDSPVKLDMTHVELVKNSVLMGKAGSSVLKIGKAAYKTRPSYTIGNVRDNPVDMAGRLVARELVAHLSRQR